MISMNKWKISLYLAGIFCAGVITGVFGAFAVGRHMMATAMRQEAMAAHWRGELQSKLNLSPAQLQKITPIINDTIANFKSGFARQTLTALSNSNARIAAELTPEQQTKFVEIERQQQEFIRKRFGDEPRPSQENP